jgi:signal transduction histidine kinase
LDELGVIVVVNDAWKNFARANNSPDPGAYLGANYLAACEAAILQGDPVARQVEQGIRAVLDGSQPQFNAEYSCDSPEQHRWFTITIAPQHQSRQGVIVTHQDITERKKAEAMLREREHQDAINEIDRQIKRFQTEITQNISHELRTPLTQILLTLDLVLRKKFSTTDDLNWFVESALSQSHKLNTIIDSLIFLSDYDLGLNSILRQKVDIMYHFTFPINVLIQQYKEKDLQISIRITNEIAIHAPINEFVLACRHLVENSLKFSPAKTAILINLESNGDGGVILTITDHGPGVPKEMREQVFERYYQISQGITRQHGGLGVGLTIARIIARSLAGDVTILPTRHGFSVQMIIPPAPLDMD